MSAKGRTLVLYFFLLVLLFGFFYVMALSSKPKYSTTSTNDLLNKSLLAFFAHLIDLQSLIASLLRIIFSHQRRNVETSKLVKCFLFVGAPFNGFLLLVEFLNLFLETFNGLCLL